LIVRWRPPARSLILAAELAALPFAAGKLQLEMNAEEGSFGPFSLMEKGSEIFRENPSGEGRFSEVLHSCKGPTNLI
jgi:hypothetical protein